MNIHYVITTQDVATMILVALFLIVLLICWIRLVVSALWRWIAGTWGQIRYRINRRHR